MRKLLMVPALALGLATIAGYAIARDEQTRVDVPRDQWLSIAQVTQKLTAQGYDVRQIKVKRDRYEIRAIDKDGERLKANVHPVTGEHLADDTDD
jgi:hypothetical protein